MFAFNGRGAVRFRPTGQGDINLAQPSTYSLVLKESLWVRDRALYARSVGNITHPPPVRGVLRFFGAIAWNSRNWRQARAAIGVVPPTGNHYHPCDNTLTPV